MSPLPVGVNSGVRHKIPPLSPRKKKDWVADSGFGITANGKNDVSKQFRFALRLYVIFTENACNAQEEIGTVIFVSYIVKYRVKKNSL